MFDRRNQPVIKYMPFDTHKEACAYFVAMSADPFCRVYEPRAATLKWVKPTQDDIVPTHDGFVVPIVVKSIDETIDKVNAERLGR